MYGNQLFNPQQLMQNCMQGIMREGLNGGNMGGSHGGGKDEYINDFNLFFTDIENGVVICPPAFGRVISRLVKAAVEEWRKMEPAAMDGNGHERHKEHHKKFKKVLEELRCAPLSDRAALIEKHFSGLDGNERLVLMELSNDRPVQKKAANNGMSEEAFMAARHSAEKKLND